MRNLEAGFHPAAQLGANKSKLTAKIMGSVLMLSALGLPVAGCGDDEEFNTGMVADKTAYPGYVKDCKLNWLRPASYDCKGEYSPERFIVKLEKCATKKEEDCKTREVVVDASTFHSLKEGQYVTFGPQKNK